MAIDPALSIVFKLPFQEQESFFKNKLNIPTARWDDLWKGQHARGFMIAGAIKAELLADFRTAVDKAISDGVTLRDFRKDFDRIVAKHGWSYNGSRNWRSEVIYSTNIRTAYAAGRWAQLTDPDMLKFYGFLVYRHGDSIHPRPLHQSWDGTTLPANDPWWDSHYVPNGWGCKCKVFAATKEEWQAAKESGKGEAPPSPIDPKTGEPVGIDKGWGYNVGKASGKDYRVLSDKFETLPADIARKWMDEFLKGPTFERFFAGRIQADFPVAVLGERERRILGAVSQTVWLSEESLRKNRGLIAGNPGHPELTLAEYQLLPEIVTDRAEVIIKDGATTMVFVKLAGRFYHAAIKTTKSRADVFLTSFRRVDDVRREVDRIKRKTGVVVVKDEL